MYINNSHSLWIRFFLVVSFLPFTLSSSPVCRIENWLNNWFLLMTAEWPLATFVFLQCSTNYYAGFVRTLFTFQWISKEKKRKRTAVNVANDLHVHLNPRHFSFDVKMKIVFPFWLDNFKWITWMKSGIKGRTQSLYNQLQFTLSSEWIEFHSPYKLSVRLANLFKSVKIIETKTKNS